MDVSFLNSRADVLKSAAALSANCMAACGLQEVMKTNLGPKGTLKMLVGGAGQIKVTKDGNVLLHEMQIQHPTASMIARVATAQDDMTGDGTTTSVLLIGELLKQASTQIAEGVHPRLVCEGIELAQKKALSVLDELRQEVPSDGNNREMLRMVAKTSLRTKINTKLADKLAEDVVDAVEIVQKPDKSIDLFMVEILSMKHQLSSSTRLIKGMVMDHGCRHPDMPKSLKNCYLLTLNVSLEYEKSEVYSGFFYSDAEQRARLVEAERNFTDEKVAKIIELKRLVCPPGSNKNFVILNQKGIDPPSLDMLAKENIMALRRVKRRNMERLTLCCGGNSVNCVDDLTKDDLGYAGLIYEQTLGEEKFTFVEDVAFPRSCAILIKGPNDHTICQIKDAIRDGLRVVKNTISDGCVIPGGGAFEIAAYCKLQEYRKTLTGKVKFGVDAFSQALLIIVKILAENSGFDRQDSILNLIEGYEKKGIPMGLDLSTGKPMSPSMEGVWDNYCVKRQILAIAPGLAEQLLLVDEIIQAGRSMRQGGP